MPTNLFIQFVVVIVYFAIMTIQNYLDTILKSNSPPRPLVKFLCALSCLTVNVEPHFPLLPSTQIKCLSEGSLPNFI